MKFSLKPTCVLPRCLSFTTIFHSVDHRASSKLFADAEREEVSPSQPPTLARRAPKQDNWTGEESIEDAVLRMLVDKYKPLRTGTVQTAEEKIRRTPPIMSTQPPTMLPISETPTTTPSPPPPSPSSPSVYRADEPILPPVEGHRPWLTTFKVPSHASASIRYGQIPNPPSPAAPTTSSDTSQSVRATEKTDDLVLRRKDRDAKKRSEIAGRLTRAKESTLDYRLGIKSSGSGARAQQVRPNPVSIKGWTSLVEERIERARWEGQFRSIRGRGRPLERSSEEHNPFIAPEEFLLNRIVQRQGAAPPWVEVQCELDAAVVAFRATLRRSWVRRAVRMLTLTRSQVLPLCGPSPSPSLADVRALRDAEWEMRERAYHDSALAEVNSLVRKYNALAPYAVRRVYYVREVELTKIYHESGEEILQEIEGRLRGSEARGKSGEWLGEDDEELHMGASTAGKVRVIRLRDLFWQWIRHGT